MKITKKQNKKKHACIGFKNIHYDWSFSDRRFSPATNDNSSVFVGVGVFTHQHWHMGMVHNVVTDTAQEGASNGAHTTRSKHYQVSLLIVWHLANDFTRGASNTFHLASNLFEEWQSHW